MTPKANEVSAYKTKRFCSIDIRTKLVQPRIDICDIHTFDVDRKATFWAESPKCILCLNECGVGIAYNYDCYSFAGNDVE